MKALFNTLAVTGAAAFAGVLLAIGVVLGGYWESLPAAGFLASFRDTLPFVGRVIVLVPTLVGLVGSLWLGWKDRGEPGALARGGRLRCRAARAHGGLVLADERRVRR